MPNLRRLSFALLVMLPLAGCDKFVMPRPAENITEEEKEAAAKLKPASNPIQQEINQLRKEVRAAFAERRFDDLDRMAKEFREGRQLFGNGSWKLVQFYSALEMDDDEAEADWERHESMHEEWIATKPQSITARVAYVEFLTGYAWQARGSGYSNTVTELGWKLMAQRMKKADEVVKEAAQLPEKDPGLFMAALTVALGQGWDRAAYDRLMADAYATEPKFWGFDTGRAYSLLPRWHGEPGDWEAFAAQTSERPDGLGIELYARIVMYLDSFYTNIFEESEASWPKTREGLEQLRKKYPDALELLSESAKLAAMAKDRETAKAMFDQLGDRYLPSVWGKPERFIHFKNWAHTGKW